MKTNKFLMETGYISENDLRKMTDSEDVSGGTTISCATAIISAVTAVTALATWVACPSSACTTSCK